MTTTALIFFTATMILMSTSSWLYSKINYFLTVVVSSIFVSLFFIDSLSGYYQANDFKRFTIELGVLLSVVGFLWFFVTSKYLTESKFLDVTYQSMDKLKEYIDQKGYRTKFEAFTIKAGYFIFFCSIIMFTLYAIKN